MTNIFKFIRYCWHGFSPETIVVIFLAAFLLSLYVANLIFGNIGIIVICTIVLALVALVLLAALYKAITDKWIEFTVQQEDEANEVVNRLKGDE